MYINYNDLQGFRELFTDYLYNFENVKKFYKKNFRDVDSFAYNFNEIKNYKRNHRDILPDIIKKQYAPFKRSKLVDANIDLLKSQNTLAIVTGQQLSLYGGPLYTFYKIITAIKLCRQLKEAHEDYNFVPVFWLEGDDHDFEEVRSVTIMDKSNQLKTISYDDGQEPEQNRGSTGKLVFGESFSNVSSLLNESLRDSEFKEELISFLNEYYTAGSNFSGAFKRLINNIFGEYGLIVFDPQDIHVKHLLKPVFKSQLEEYMNHSDVMIETSAELEDTFHAQVKVKPINLFLHESDGRYSIEPGENHFKLKNKRKQYSLEELLERLENHPEDFSASVLLRPICQDFLLPTAFYVGGPSEIAYFAQVIPLYDFYNVIQPYIFPRASLTIVEKNIVSLIEKFELNISDVFDSDKQLNSKVLNKFSEVDVKTIFDSTSESVKFAFDNLKEKLFAVDPTLVDSSNRSQEKILGLINNLQGKTEKASERSNQTVVKQLEKLRNNLYPGEEYQERVLNFTTYSVKYGNDFIKMLLNELSINKFEHQILEI